ncbi:integrase, catalytic region, zinc finger, CCHC-type containing protein [Tanacetum coccineum]
MQVNVQFLQQLQPEWSRFVTVVKKATNLDTKSYHNLFDILKQYQNEVNEIPAERIARNANHRPLWPTHYTLSTMNKGKEIVKPPSPQSESASEEDNTSPRTGNDRQTGQFRNQRIMIVVGNRESVGNQVVQQSRIQCFNCKGFGHFSKECRKPKRVKAYDYMLCKQKSKGIPLSAKQDEWLHDTDEEPDEQELEAHYMYMAKIQEVLHAADDNS